MTFAIRSFEVGAEGGRQTIELRFESPIHIGRGAYHCTYSIAINGNTLREFRVMGNDAVQAVLFAFSAAANDVKFHFPEIFLVSEELLADMMKI